MRGLTRAIAALLVASAGVACQLVAGIDSRSVYVDSADAADGPASGGDAGAGNDGAVAETGAGEDGGEPCTKEGQKECMHASQPRTCTNGFWKNEIACSGSTPSCKDGTCVSSCTGLANDCGGNRSCCEALPVAKHAVLRSYDGTYLTDGGYIGDVSDFRLDTFEVTVARFRAFVDAYPKSLPARGAGKNPHDASDPGWDDAWVALMPTDRDDLATKLACNAQFQTWTGSNANDHEPINCITWYEAYAFCIWDGGRLPTETEWNAAAAGTDSRPFPWGGNDPHDAGDGGEYAAYDCIARGDCATGGAVKNVGSFPRGAGAFGQMDLAGNLHEWVLDAYVDPYILPCHDCAQHDGGANRVMRGGDYGSPVWAAPAILADQGSVLTSYRQAWDPNKRSSRHGVRCARAAGSN